MFVSPQPPFAFPIRGVRMDRGNSAGNQSQHRHLVYSPYKAPNFPPLYPTSGKEVQASPSASSRLPAPSQASPGPSQASPATTQTPQMAAYRALPSPRPPQERLYVQPPDPTSYLVALPVPVQPDNNPFASPDTIGNVSCSGSISDTYDDRLASISTTMSSTGDEQEGQPKKEKRKKKSSRLSSKVKSAVKDLFTREEKGEPVTAIKRESNPWDDEDY